MSKKNPYKKGSVYCFADAGSEEVMASLKDVDVDNLPADAQIPIEIPIFRQGKFEHPRYRSLNFDEDYLNSMVANHKNGVLSRAVAFDFDHREFSGAAAAWVREDVPDPLVLRNVSVPSPDGTERKLKVLFAKVYLNRDGAKAIKGRKYRYFSSEVHPNYSSREKIQMNDDDEAVIEHGPVLLGGGLTNNPFIPGLGDYTFSNDAANSALEDGEKLLSDSGAGIHLFSIVDDIEEPSSEEHEHQEIESPEPAQTKHNFGDELMEKLLQQYEAATSNEERLTILDQASTMEFADAGANSVTISLLRKQTEEAIANKMAFDQIVADNARKEERVNKLAADNASLVIKAQKASEQAYETRVNLFCEELRNAKHFEGVVNKAKEVLLNSPVSTRDAEYKFSEGQESALDLMGVISELFEALPETARMDFSESFNTQEDELNGKAVETQPEGGKQEFSEGEEEDEDAEAKAKAAELERRAQLYKAEYGEAPGAGLMKYIDKDGRLQPTPVED